MQNTDTGGAPLSGGGDQAPGTPYPSRSSAAKKGEAQQPKRPKPGQYPPRTRSARSRAIWDALCATWADGARLPNLTATAEQTGAARQSVSRIWRRYFAPHLSPEASPAPDPAAPPDARPPSLAPAPPTAPGWDELERQMRTLIARTLELELHRLEWCRWRLRQGDTLKAAMRSAGRCDATALRNLTVAAGIAFDKARQIQGGDSAPRIVIITPGETRLDDGGIFDQPPIGTSGASSYATID